MAGPQRFELTGDKPVGRPTTFSSASDSRARSLTSRRVLIVDDDQGMREVLEAELPRHDIRVLSAASGQEALHVSAVQDLDCAVIDQRLPDMEGTELAKALRHGTNGPPFILISGFLSVAVAVEATRLGAHAVLEKPCETETVVAAVMDALATPANAGGAAVTMSNGLLSGQQSRRSVAERWASYVLEACESEHDLKTLAEWARLVAVSYSSLSETCRILSIRPNDAKDFARVLRALIHARRHDCFPEALLDISDRRTLSLLLERSCAATMGEFRNCTVSAFLRNQRLVPPKSEGLKIVCALIAKKGY